MRKASMKKLTVALLGGCALTCLAMGSALVPADAETIKPVLASTESFNVVDGADLYLYTGEATDAETDNNGMRFRFEVSVTTFESLLNADKTGFNREWYGFGALVVPTYLLETTEAATTEDVVNSPYTYTEVLPFEKWTLDTGLTSAKNSNVDGKVYYACAYLYNMPFYTYNVEYSACAYMQSSQTAIAYTNTVTRSMTTTAQNAIDSGDYASDATKTDLLNEYVVAENEINNFDFSNSLEFSGQNIWQRTRQSYAGKSEWHKEWGGRTGVAQLSESNIYADPNKSSPVVAINFAPRQLKSAYEGYTHIVFSMYIDDPNNQIEWFNFVGDGANVGAQIPASEIVRGDWKEYALPIDAFINNYDNFLQSSASSYLGMRRKAGTPTALNLFIDSIYVANMPTAAFETSLVEQEVGVEFTLPTATVENAETVTYTLTKPDSSTETVTAGQAYTATMAGTYTLTVDVTAAAGLTASASMTFNVVDLTGMVEINNYNTQAKVSGVANSTTVNALTYHPVYKEKTGVISIFIASGTKPVWRSIYWNPQNDLSAIPADHNYLVITLWADANLSLVDFTQYDTTISRVGVVGSGFGDQIVPNQWNNIYVPISVFKDNYDAIVAKTASASFISFRNNGSSSTVYIDSIYTVKKEATAALSADVEESSTQTLESEASYVQASVVTAGADKRSLVYNV